MLTLCALHLSAHESAGAALSVGAAALGLLLAAVISLRLACVKTKPGKAT